MTAVASPPPTGEVGPPQPATARVAASLDRVWDRLVALRAWIAVGLLLALTVARTGIGVETGDTIHWVRLARAFPQPLSDWRTSSVTGPALARLLGMDTVEGWLVLHSLMIVLVVGLVGVLVATRFPTRQARMVAAIWLALGSVAPAVAQKVGWYDVYLVAGVALVVWGGRRGTAVVGGVLIGLTSAEQGVVGLVGAAVVAAALVDEHGDGIVGRIRRMPILPDLVAAGAALALARLAVLAVQRTYGIVVPTRADVFGRYLGDSLGNAATAGLSGVYAYLGLGWGLVLLAALALRWDRRRTATVLAGLVALPALVTVTTLDGTRVFAMVSMPAYLVLVARVADGFGAGTVERSLVRRATTAALLAAPLFPALMTAPTGDAHFVFPFGGI